MHLIFDMIRLFLSRGRCNVISMIINRQTLYGLQTILYYYYYRGVSCLTNDSKTAPVCDLSETSCPSVPGARQEVFVVLRLSVKVREGGN